MNENPYETPLTELNQVLSWSPSVLEVLFSFTGRIKRLTYWVCTIGLSFAGSAVGYFASALRLDQWPQPEWLLSILSTVTGILVLWVTLAVQVKRWHDRDKSGWWCLINLIPVIGTLWNLIELGLLPGSRHSNRFGPPQA